MIALMTGAPLLTITDAARQKILDVRAGEPDPARWRCGSK